MRKTESDKRVYFKYIAVALAAVFLISSVLMIIEIWDRRHGDFPEQGLIDDRIEYEGQKYRLNDDVQTFLVLGLDKMKDDDKEESFSNDKQADFLLLYVFDNSTKRYVAVHINRDTMAEMNILDIAGNKIRTETRQIALAHNQGNGGKVSCRNVADSVSKLLNGVKITNYLSVTMDAVPVYNDLLGGVEVTVLDDFSGIDDTLVKGETVTLMGEHALTYVRTRYGLEDSSNSTRMERQKQYVSAAMNKTSLKMSSDEAFIVDASVKMSDYIVSDRTVEELQMLAEKINKYEFDGIKTISGESKAGERYIEFYPDKSSVDELVIELFYKLDE